LTETSNSADSATDCLRTEISESSLAEIIVTSEIEPVAQRAPSSTEYDSLDEDEDESEVDLVEHQINSEDSDGGKGLMLTWEQQRKLIMSRGRKPQQDIGASVSLKDRMRAFNASSSSMGAAMDSPHALNTSSSSMGAAMDTHVGGNNYMDGVDGAVKEPDVRRGNLKDQKTSLSSSSNATVPGVQTKIHMTSDNITDTGYQQDTAEEELPKAKFEMEIPKNDAEDMSRNEASIEKPNEKVAAIDIKNEALSEDCDGGKGLMLSWEQHRKLIMARGRKPQQDIGASVSLKDRMRAFNASSSSMGTALDDL
jgi:hypothetical protein